MAITKKRPEWDDWGREQIYERLPRLPAHDAASRSQEKILRRLPIKTLDGKVKLMKNIKEYSSDDDSISSGDEEISTEDSDRNHHNGAAPRSDAASGLVGSAAQSIKHSESIVQLAERIAGISEQIIAKPEEHIDKLAQLLHIARDSENPAAAQLALLSEVAVVETVLPGYRIRNLSAAEQQQRTSREVRQQRQYEQKLLGHYERFVSLLEYALVTDSSGKISNGNTPSSNRDITSNVIANGDAENIIFNGSCAIESYNAIKRARELNVQMKKAKKHGKHANDVQQQQEHSNGELLVLLESCSDCAARLTLGQSHFNSSDRVQMMTVKSALTQIPSAAAADRALRSIQETLATDVAGDISLAIVQISCRLAKKHGYLFAEMKGLLHILLSVKVLDDADADTLNQKVNEVRAGKKRRTKVGHGHLSRRQLKHQKELREIEKEMKEADAVVQTDKISQNQRCILKFLFPAILRALVHFDRTSKAGTIHDEFVLKLLLATFEKYAQLVSVDMFADVIQVFREFCIEKIAPFKDNFVEHEGIVKSAEHLSTDYKKRQRSGSLGNDGLDTDMAAAIQEYRTDKGSHFALRSCLLALRSVLKLLFVQNFARANYEIDMAVFIECLYAALAAVPKYASLQRSTTDQINPDDPIKMSDEKAEYDLEKLLLDAQNSRQSNGVHPSSSSIKELNTLASSLDAEPDDSDAQIALDCVEIYFLRRRQSGSTLILAFFKRLATMALALPEQLCCSTLLLMNKLLSRYSFVEDIMSTHQKTGDGLYDATIQNPLLSQAQNAVLYEIPVLLKSFSPNVKIAARNLLSGKR